PAAHDGPRGAARASTVCPTVRERTYGGPQGPAARHVRGAAPFGSRRQIFTKKAEALLAYLALHPGKMQARGKLAALLWRGSEKRARHSLRQALVTIRSALSRARADRLVQEGDTVGVVPAAVEVDVATFERLARDESPE